MTIVIAGGSGFLGRKLAKRLADHGHSVVTLSRRPSGGGNTIPWQPDGNPGALPQHLEGVDAVVNLAGENIADKRWTAARKAALRNSRILSTRTLVRAVALCADPPNVFISGSAIGYYGARGDEPITESTHAGSDFLARLCVEWEAEARKVESDATRLVIVRTGLPLDRDEGALGKMLLPFKLCLGATLGSGDQFMPWIHVEDWTAMISWLIQNDRAAASSTSLRLRRSRIARSPKRSPASSIGPPSSTHRHLCCARRWEKWRLYLVHGQRVLPAAAEQLGFRFTHRTLGPALESLDL